MRLLRCSACKCGFVIVSAPAAKKSTKKAGLLTCPLCQSEDVAERDPVEALGGQLAREALKFWNRLPSGD